MGKKGKAEFDVDAFSAELEKMASTPKPAPVREESELIKQVRKHYDVLKQAIVERGWSYANVSELLIRSGLRKGASPPSVKAALIKVAAERGETWDYKRGNQDDSSKETSTGAASEKLPLLQTKSANSSKFVDMPEAL